MDNAADNWPRMQLEPIGRVCSEIRMPMPPAGESDREPGHRLDKIRQYHEKVMHGVCQLIIFPQWQELLDGIEGFSHILVLYWPHLLDPQRRCVRRVHPMGRKDLPSQGVFATCSPARPNPVLVSTVRLVGRRGNVLDVASLDAVDGSPIIDIKPYVPISHGAEHPTLAAWMEQIHRELGIDVTIDRPGLKEY
jgi:tRNA-Thr(GGU) m(6)t(6)A37 methyltransferase TsaA